MEDIRDKLKQYTYYILIAILSMLSLVVLPMLGSNVDIHTIFPKTLMGWCIYIINRLAVIIINMLIFSNFISQGKLNIVKDPKYIEATAILMLNKSKDYAPQSPKIYLSKTYLKKGGSLVLGSILAFLSIGSSILTYDLMVLLASVFTIIMAIICGIMTMKKVELYYTTEYYDYAKLVEKENTKND